MSTNKKRLGTGLRALFGDTGVAEFSDKGISQISLDDIAPSSEQPRKHFEENKLQELMTSIKAHGVISPIILQKKSDGKYRIIAGERRYRASKSIGLKTVPAIVRDIKNSEVLEIALIENIQRDDLNPIEEAEACLSLIDKYSYTHQKLAERIGKNRTYLTNLLRILSLPKEVLDYVREGKVTFGHAKVLVGKKDALALAQLIISKNLSVRQTEKLVSQHKSISVDRYLKSEDLRSLEEMISNRLKFKVKIKAKSNRSGEVSLKFGDFNQLDTILQFLNNIN